MNNKTIRFASIPLLFLFLSITGCIKDNNPPLPAYIHVADIGFLADSTQGTSSYKIKDMWLSVDGQQIGANATPTTFPIILDENFQTNTIRIAAGIEENGINNSRRIYPFYEPFETTIDLVAGQVDTFSPILRYDTTATIETIEDFEPTGTVFSDDKDGNPNTFMRRQSTDVFEGDFSGQLVLDSANLECVVATAFKYSNLQPVGTSFPVYLEMNYKTNNIMSVGIIAHYNNGSTQTTYIAGVNRKNYWNKIYFNLTETVFGSGANQFSIIFQATKQQDVSDPQIFVDNIKLVHF